MSTLSHRTHEYRGDGSLVLSSDVIIERAFKPKAVNTGKSITSLQASPCGKYVAVGDVMGCVTVRSSSNIRLQLLSCNTGTGRVSALAWHRSSPNTIFVGSANGHVNAVQFDGDLQNPRNPGAVKVTGLVTSLKVNESATQIAVSFGYNVSIFKLPFQATTPGPGGRRLLALPEALLGYRVEIERLSLDNWRTIPVRNHPRPLCVDYIGDHELCVAYFGKFEIYNTSSMTDIELLYTIAVPPETAVGSFAISPNGEYIAATNTKSGIDWYSTRMKQHISKTTVKDSYNRKSFIMPIAFLTESTVVCGHHSGLLAVAQHGHDKPRVLGELSDTPVRCVSVAITTDLTLIAVAVGKELVVHPLPVASPNAKPIRNNPPIGTSHLPSPGPSRHSSVVGNGFEGEHRPPTRPGSPASTLGGRQDDSMYGTDTPTPSPRNLKRRGRVNLHAKSDDDFSPSPSPSRTRSPITEISTPPGPPGTLPPDSNPAFSPAPGGLAALPDINLNAFHTVVGLPIPPPDAPEPQDPIGLASGLATIWRVVWKWNPKVALTAGALSVLLIGLSAMKAIQMGSAVLRSGRGLHDIRETPTAWDYAPASSYAAEGNKDQKGGGPVDRRDERDDESEEGGEEDNGDLDDNGEESQLVLTETKLLTVTKTLTKTSTKTVTETPSTTVTIYNTPPATTTGRSKRPRKAQRSHGK